MTHTRFILSYALESNYPAPSYQDQMISPSNCTFLNSLPLTTIKNLINSYDFSLAIFTAASFQKDIQIIITLEKKNWIPFLYSIRYINYCFGD